MSRGWYGVDFDGTLAYHRSGDSCDKGGTPVPAMVTRVKSWHALGIEVRILTARVNPIHGGAEVANQTKIIEEWCKEHLGFRPPITCSKDYNMLCLFDDRCIQVEKNTGRLLGEPDIIARNGDVY